MPHKYVVRKRAKCHLENCSVRSIKWLDRNTGIPCKLCWHKASGQKSQEQNPYLLMSRPRGLHPAQDPRSSLPFQLKLVFMGNDLSTKPCRAWWKKASQPSIGKVSIKNCLLVHTFYSAAHVKEFCLYTQTQSLFYSRSVPFISQELSFHTGIFVKSHFCWALTACPALCMC